MAFAWIYVANDSHGTGTSPIIKALGVNCKNQMHLTTESAAFVVAAQPTIRA